MTAGRPSVCAADAPARETRRGRESYAYASGLVRAIELRLIDQAALNRLAEAPNGDAVRQILGEFGYPEAIEPEEALDRESAHVYAQAREWIREQGVFEILLLFHDIHNAKALLKSILPEAARSGQLARSDTTADDGRWADTIQESLIATDDHLFLTPSIIDPATLRRAIVERRTETLPTWLQGAIDKAVAAYTESYDLGTMDDQLDRHAWAEAIRRADCWGNAWLRTYLSRRVDLINLELLLRLRRDGLAIVEPKFLSGGSRTPAAMSALADASDEQIVEAYADTPYQRAAAVAPRYGEPGVAAHFGLTADEILLQHLRAAQQITVGPEIPLAYLLARLMEIKNIRILLAGLRGGLPVNEVRQLFRGNYLAWR